MILAWAVVTAGPLSDLHAGRDHVSGVLLITSKQEGNVEELKLGECFRPAPFRDLRLLPLQRTLTLFVPSCCLSLENVKFRRLW